MPTWITFDEYDEETTAPIDVFEGKWFVFSNFAPCTIKYDGNEYPSVEHAYQASKTLSEEERKTIRQAATPANAKQLGKSVTLRTNWSKKKLKLMEKFLRQKFSRDTDYLRILLRTGEREIIEGNTWHDTYWGVCNGKGKNHLGKIIMKIREDNQPHWFDFLTK